MPVAVRRTPVLLAAVLALVLALVAAGCGSSSSGDRFKLRTPPARSGGAKGSAALNKQEPITRAEKRVILGWASTLRRGHVARAARYFALPAVVSNGFSPIKITTRKQARAFNRILTCGAQVTGLERQAHHLVLTTFQLVDRTGPGAKPCTGGGIAHTAFRIERGRITQWYRVPEPSASSGPQSSS